MRRSRSLYVVLGLLAGCNGLSANDTAQVASVPSCQGWNEAERTLAPQIPTMTAQEHGIFKGVFAVLTGGDMLNPDGTGLCRQPAPPTAIDAFDKAVSSAMAQLGPLLTKYASK